MTEIILTILFTIFIVCFICIAIVLISISLVHKSLLCAKFYCFFFEHDDWLLYKKAKKQGIQHYLNGHHFSLFYDEWNNVKEEYGIVEDNFTTINEKVADELLSKHNELSEKYNYKEYNDADKSINDDDIVLSLSMYSELLYICAGNSAKNALHWKPMVKDILNGCEIWTNGKTDNVKRLLTNPKEVISF